jgi:ribonuclease BN (tRNA processing enzyme)
MTRPYFPVEMSALPAKISFHELQKRNTIAGITIHTIVNNHPDYTLGLKLSEGKKSFVFLSDNELFAKGGNTPYEGFVEFVKGVDFCVHDAQYTDEDYDRKIGWGHSTFTQSMRLVKDAGVKRIFFTHHDHGSDDQFIDNMLRKMKRKYPRVTIEAAADGKKVILK